MMSSNRLPPADHLELSLFGAGIGECVVVHLGAGNWAVVDSCLNASREKPIAAEYLEGLGVDIANQVKLVAVTHWHDDHIRGIAQMLNDAANAEFACSAALRHEEFLALVGTNQHIKLVEHNSGVSEFADVLEILQSRSKTKRAVGPRCWAAEGMLVYRDSASGSEVHALSPSAQTITDARGELARLLPTGGPIRPFVAVGPNDLSVALLIKSRGLHLLLGGDLPTGRDDQRGWRAVVLSNRCPQVNSCAYKIAHHGSPNSDLDAIWKDLLDPERIGVLTPYARGPSPLPSQSDIARIKRCAQRAFCTAPSSGVRPQRRPGIERTMNEVTRSRRAIPNAPGHVRLRLPINGCLEQATIELFGKAMRL